MSNIMSKSVSQTVRVDEMFDEYHQEKYTEHLKGYKMTIEQQDAEKKAEAQHKVDIARCQV